MTQRQSTPTAVVATLLCLATACAAVGCAPFPGSDAGAAPGGADAAAGPAPGEWFTEGAAAAGLDFVHFNGMTGDFHQTEIMGPGVALLDYDNDGDLDVYVTQGRTLGSGDPLIPPPEGPLTDRLYRNDLEPSPDGPRLRFTDVSAGSGLNAGGHGMGAAAGDYDNDGWVDLYLTGFERNRLFRNNGDGTFSDVSEESGTHDPDRWGVSAAFLDYDRDGWLDLFVGNYLSFSLDTHIPCFNRSGPPDYCPPEVYRAQPDRLYRNRGDGTFVDATAEAGVAWEFGPALGVSTADFDNDGWAGHLRRQRSAGEPALDQPRRRHLRQPGAVVGGGVGGRRGSQGGHGRRRRRLRQRRRRGPLRHRAHRPGQHPLRQRRLRPVRGAEHAGVRCVCPACPIPASGPRGSTSTTTAGWTCSRSTATSPATWTALGPDNPFPLQQRNLLFRNRGDGRFDDVTDRAGEVFRLSEVSRGAAFGDVDNDGDVDVLVGNGAGPLRLLVNRIGEDNRWVGLRLVGGDAPRDMIGARVEVVLGGRLAGVAPRPRRRQLCLRAGSARPDRARSVGGPGRGARHVAERAHRDVARRSSRPLHDAAGRRGRLT